MKFKFNIMIIFLCCLFDIYKYRCKVCAFKRSYDNEYEIIENHSWSRKLNTISPNYDPNSKICNKCKKVVYEII